jgi:hypothetical protein
MFDNLFDVTVEDFYVYKTELSPYKSFGLSSNADKFILHKIAKLLPANALVVEIGTYLGASMAIMAHANNELEIHAYDLFDDKSYHPKHHQLLENSLGSEKIRTLENVSNFLKIYPNIHLHAVGQSPVKFERLVDLFIEDSSHTNPQLAQSLANWLPKVKVNGLALLHDYRPWKELNDEDRFIDVESHVKSLSNSKFWKFLGVLENTQFDEPSSYAVMQRIKPFGSKI